MSGVPGDELELRAEHLKWMWMGVFAVVALFGYGMTNWEVIEHLLDNEGVGEEGASLIAFAAGYTLPLTVGVGVVALMHLRGVMREWSAAASALAVAGVLFAAGYFASALGLGLLPSFDATLPEGGHPIARVFVWVLKGYFNTYGWPLMVCAVSIGAAVGLQINSWVRVRPTAIERSPSEV